MAKTTTTIGGGAFYELTLFVSGASDLAGRAIADCLRLCENHLSGRYHLSIVDVQDDSSVILGAGVLATPTLVKSQPCPARRVVGDVSHIDRVLRLLELPFTEKSA